MSDTQNNRTPLEQLRSIVVADTASKWSGLVHNRDDGRDSAERAFDSVLDAIKEAGGVVLMPTRGWDLAVGDSIWLKHPLQDPFSPVQTRPDFVEVDDIAYVNVLDES